MIHSASIGSVWLLALVCGSPGSSDRSAVDYAALGREVVQAVRSQFYDPKRATGWTKTHANYAADVRTQEEFAEQTKAALAELNASHVGYYTPAEVEYYGLSAVFARTLGKPAPPYDSIGADFARLPGGIFVRTVFAQSPAEKAGLVRGDRILSADGKPFDPVLSFRKRSGKSVTLQIERRANEPPLEKHVTPRRINPKDEWLEAQRLGSRVIEREGRRIGYVPMFSCAGEEHHDMLEKTLQKSLHEADALIIDFRNGWGGCNPQFVNLFNKTIPSVTMINRGGHANTSGPWEKPVVLLINQGSRSGKEIVAFALKKHKRATLVGARTAGAVLGGTAELLSDQSLLYLAVVDVRVDGEVLEGKGVEPDIAMPDVLPYAAGNDPQLDKALRVAAGLN